MDLITLALAKKYTETIGSGISSITAVGNTVHFVTTSLDEFDITLPYSIHSHTNLDIILEKLTLDGNGILLFDGNPILGGGGGIGDLTSFTTDDLAESATKKYVSPTEKSTWSAKSDFDGNYNSLTNTPTIPSVDVDKLYVDTGLGLKVDKVSGSSLVTDVDITKITTNETNITDITTQLTVAEVVNVYTLDLALKKSFTIDITNATAKTIAFSNIPGDLDFAKPVTIKVICSVGNTISTYPTGIVWVDGVVPIYTIGKTYYLTFMRIANGWHGVCLGAF